MNYKYYYTKMAGDEFKEAVEESGLSFDECRKLLNRTVLSLGDYMTGKKSPTVLECVVMDFLKEYDYADVFMELVEKRINGKVSVEEILKQQHGENYIPPEERSRT